MTEAEWLARPAPIRMVEHIKGKTDGRKWRLLATGCVRLYSQYLDNAAVQSYLTAFDEYADSRISLTEVIATWGPAHRHMNSFSVSSVAGLVKDMLFDLTSRERHRPNAYWVARSTVSEVGRVVIWARHGPPSENDDTIQRAVGHAAALVRDIFGNPFRPITLNPSWLTSTVVALANGIYDEKAFDRMPILADALMDAGCDNNEILNHCRGPGPHTRGCFVIDLLTGRE